MSLSASGAGVVVADERSRQVGAADNVDGVAVAQRWVALDPVPLRQLCDPRAAALARAVLAQTDKNQGRPAW
jgi:hypothetical protein